MLTVILGIILYVIGVKGLSESIAILFFVSIIFDLILIEDFIDRFKK